MSKLERIKAELAKMLLKFETVKTDNGVLEYEGELAVDTEVFVTDAETEERTPAADGEYVLEDGRTLVVAGGKITEIKEASEPETEPEQTEETEPEQTEEVAAEETEPETEPEQTEETEPEQTEETTEEIPALEKRIMELEKVVEELKESYKALAEKVLKIVEETEEKFSKMSLAKPAVEEFEQAKPRKTGMDAKVDKFIEKFGNK